MRNFKPFLVFVLVFFVFSCGGASAETYTSTTAGTHAISADGVTVSYDAPTVTKTGDVSGSNDDYDWKGTNAAVWAGNGAELTITGGTINSEATYGNAVFSYGGNNSNTNNNAGDGTTVNISDTTITTTKNNSGGIMTTGGGIMNASNLTVKTKGDSSAAIRSDSGGGTVTVNGGYYTTYGTGSPAIYSTAAITVTGADLTAWYSQGVVIEGGNSVTLTNSHVFAQHLNLNGQDTTHQGILIYKSMSKDASSGKAYFKMTNGSITSRTGDMFCVTNTSCSIDITNVDATTSGNFLRVEGQKWGTSGSNGGTVDLTASNQGIVGDIIVDDYSSLTMTLKDSSTFKGAFNPDTTSTSSFKTSAATSGVINVVVEEGSKLTLSGNSYITSLTVANSSDVDYGDGGYTLNIDGTEYTASNPAPAGTTGDPTKTSGSNTTTGGSGTGTGTGTGTDTDTDSGSGSESESGTGTIGSSSGGCNAGYMSAMALLACVYFLRKK